MYTRDKARQTEECYFLYEEATALQTFHCYSLVDVLICIENKLKRKHETNTTKADWPTRVPFLN